MGGKVLTAAELEASMAPRRTPPNVSQPKAVSQGNSVPIAKTGYPAHMKTSAALEMLRNKGLLGQNGPLLPSQVTPANDLYSVLPAGIVTPPAPPNVGKVTTVSELEASFKDIGLQGRGGPENPELQTPQGKFQQPPPHQQQRKGSGPPQPTQQQHVPTSEQQKIAQQLHQLQQQQQQQQQGNKPQMQTPQCQPRMDGPPTDSGMSAFNKLVGLMKASGSLPQTPKMPVSPLM